MHGAERQLVLGDIKVWDPARLYDHISRSLTYMHLSSLQAFHEHDPESCASSHEKY
jgi:hypothetical protein